MVDRVDVWFCGRGGSGEVVDAALALGVLAVGVVGSGRCIVIGC